VVAHDMTRIIVERMIQGMGAVSLAVIEFIPIVEDDSDGGREHRPVVRGRDRRRAPIMFHWVVVLAVCRRRTGSVPTSDLRRRSPAESPRIEEGNSGRRRLRVFAR
jgi:hypothetical protein